MLMALLQPAPEVFDLFDDVMLLSEGALMASLYCCSLAVRPFDTADPCKI